MEQRKFQLKPSTQKLLDDLVTADIYSLPAEDYRKIYDKLAERIEELEFKEHSLDKWI